MNTYRKPLAHLLLLCFALLLSASALPPKGLPWIYVTIASKKTSCGPMDLGYNFFDSDMDNDEYTAITDIKESYPDAEDYRLEKFERKPKQVVVLVDCFYKCPKAMRPVVAVGKGGSVEAATADALTYIKSRNNGQAPAEYKVGKTIK